MDFSHTALEALFLLLAGHALADFGLQTEFVARFKSQQMRFKDNINKRDDLVWIHVLASHSLIHGLMVYLVLQNIWLALAETVVHGLIDHAKSANRFGFHTDQFLHLGSKLVWWIIWMLTLSS
ncbi:MAG: DUF3307 domain-containing protein [Gammaproteobacteria bacterium]|nr:DUF3307 domain-containing protein [Gammaproteobacteria bacterium]